MIDKIKARIAGAEKGSKAGTFHCEVLLHADELQNYDPIAFCKQVGFPITYATKFRKMVKLSKILSERGLAIQDHKNARRIAFGPAS